MLSAWSFSRGSELYFIERPEEISVIEGAPVNLTCKINQDHGVQYHWEIDGNLVSASPRRFQSGSNLIILHADRFQDSGQFVCQAKSRITGFRLKTEPVSLNVQWIGNCSVYPAEPTTAIKAGSSVVLQCKATGSGEIHHEWFRNTERLSKSQRYDVRKDKLHLKSASAEDNGVYRCSSRNEAGFTTSETNFILAVKDENGVVIDVIPKDQLLRLGEDARFNCKYQGIETVQWFFKETPLINSTSRLTISPNGTLIIKSVTDQDAGVYKCLGDKQEYIAELKIVHLGILTEHNFEPMLHENHVMPAPYGKKFQISCNPTQGYPKPTVWWKGPKSHKISNTGKIHADNNILVIEKAAPADSGTYTCVNENIAGTTEMQIHVKVIKQHNITQHPYNVTVDEGHSVRMECKHSGMKHHKHEKHFTKIQWFREGKLLRLENGRIMFNESDGSLTFTQTIPRDKGSYTCEVITQGFLPVASIPGTLNIKEKLKFSPAPLNKNLELGSMGKIHCKANGTPPPTIVWKMEDLDNDLPDDVEDVNGTLIFKSVSQSHNGRYTCRAFNLQGSINVTIVVTAVVSPKFTLVSNNPTEVVEGAQIMLHCQATGLPKPTVHWDQNLQMDVLKNDRFVVFDNGTLLIKEAKLEDQKQYGCTAGNSGGLRREEISLIVRSIHDEHQLHDSSGEGVTRAVVVTVAIAIAYILLVVALTVWCKCRRNRKAQLNKMEFDTEEIKLNGECSKAKYTVRDEDQNEDDIQEIGDKPKEVKTDGFDTANSNCSANSKGSKKSSCYDKISLNRDALSEYLKVGAGQFGDIMVAQLTIKPPEIAPDTEKPNKQMVLVKSLTNTKDENALAEFKRQLDLYYKIQCDQVVKLLGLCRETNPHLMVLEFTDWGDFKQFLLATKGAKSEGSQPPPLQVPQILSLCHQICKGMEYISKSRLVHKDLACRNCVIDSKLCIKISHSAASQDIYKDEYVEHSNQMIPLRWMPHEAVFEDDYSTKSDVYSFAWVVWEIFTGASLPFSKLKNEEVLEQLRSKSLKQDFHEDMADCLKEILKNCWSYCPNDRPSFSKICAYFKEYLAKEFQPLEENTDAIEKVES
ncbi:tyrosine-protein kinase-like otk [Ctenocephalides felis]|uniref:tyrosine-protein kinase-like otk n=1 Tax=Ctenocephalides felis TaxID=7515 RepID=UPI000E6E56E2|nr:tyrosine-protein kinase-like otk [Ctenocephalides felis]